jgi:hypothetical protein
MSAADRDVAVSITKTPLSVFLPINGPNAADIEFNMYQEL